LTLLYILSVFINFLFFYIKYILDTPQ